MRKRMGFCERATARNTLRSGELIGTVMDLGVELLKVGEVVLFLPDEGPDLVGLNCVAGEVLQHLVEQGVGVLAASTSRASRTWGRPGSDHRAAPTRPGADSRAAPAGCPTQVGRVRQRGSFRSTCGTSLRKARLELETRNSRGRTARLPRRSGRGRERRVRQVALDPRHRPPQQEGETREPGAGETRSCRSRRRWWGWCRGRRRRAAGRVDHRRDAHRETGRRAGWWRTTRPGLPPSVSRRADQNSPARARCSPQVGRRGGHRGGTPGCPGVLRAPRSAGPDALRARLRFRPWRGGR